MTIFDYIFAVVFLAAFCLIVGYMLYDVSMEVKRPMVTRKSLFSIIRKHIKK